MADAREMRLQHKIGDGSPIKAVTKKLVEAGLYTPKLIKHVTDKELLAIAGISPGMLKKIREAFPYLGG